jgi:hypothetical protein
MKGLIMFVNWLSGLILGASLAVLLLAEFGRIC